MRVKLTVALKYPWNFSKIYTMRVVSFTYIFLQCQNKARITDKTYITLEKFGVETSTLTEKLKAQIRLVDLPFEITSPKHLDTYTRVLSNNVQLV
jgi:hypothetical protein